MTDEEHELLVATADAVVDLLYYSERFNSYNAATGVADREEAVHVNTVIRQAREQLQKLIEAATKDKEEKKQCEQDSSATRRRPRPG